MAIVLLVLGLFTPYVCSASRNAACLTPGGDDGTCQPLSECPSLLEISNNKNATRQEMDLLLKSMCGFQDVCCPNPNPCSTPEGHQGECVSIYFCPHLANLVKIPLTPDNIQYLRNSRCAGKDKYSVCCGPPRVQSSEVIRGNCAANVSPHPPDPRSDCCGIDPGENNYLISYSTSLDQFPWLAIIEYTSGDEVKMLCGGALISGRYVLTAAHCVTGDILKAGIPKNIRLGEYDIIKTGGVDCVEVEAGGLDCTEGTTVIPIERTIPHPDYSVSNNPSPHDIALIRLKQNAPYTDFIRPICLPSTGAIEKPPSNSYVKSNVYVSGWGIKPSAQPSSNVKLYNHLPYEDNQICEEAAKSLGVKNINLTSQICAGSRNGQNSCMGDSGGPLIYENGRHYDVVGVYSLGPESCNSTNVTGVYTKVYDYKDWIISTIVL